METIEKYIEQLISLTGINGDTIPVMRHILLVLAAFLLAFLAGYVCRKLLVPLILKLTAKTDTSRCLWLHAKLYRPLSYGNCCQWCSTNIP